MPTRARSWIDNRQTSRPLTRISPDWRWARPAISSSSVVFPTPLRPTMATVSPALTDRLRRSTIVVGPQPPVRSTTSSTPRLASETRSAGISQINSAYVRRRHHVSGLAGHEYSTVDEYVDLGRKSPHHVHVVLDHQDSDLRWQAVDGVEQHPDLVGRDPGRRLVEQQHLGFERERDGDFEQPLHPIGNFRDPMVP